MPYCIPLGLKDFPHSTIVYDSNGDEIGEVVKDKTYRHISLNYDDFPPFLVNIVVGLEDHRFRNHDGIDWIGLFRAMKTNFQNGSIVQGGSTISAQLVRNTYRLNQPRNIFRKFAEFYIARIWNKHHEKKTVLSQYLNTIYFGYLNYGFASASRCFFAKPLSHLTKSEMIALLTIPRNPALYDPYKQPKQFQQRYQMLVKYFLDNKIISSEEYEIIKNEKLIWNTNHQNQLPYVVDLIEKYFQAPSKQKLFLTGSSSQSLNQEIYTSIDMALSQKIYDMAYSTIMDLLWKNVGDFGVLVIDKQTNQIKVLLGGINYKSDNGQVNSVTSLNQAGSAIKPFTYALAFQNLGLKPNDTILDLPVQFQTEQGYGYTPKNYNLEYKGEVTLAEALSQSLNIPAVKLAEKIGVQKLLTFLKKVGISSLNHDADYYGLALTLGVGEVSLWDLTRAYGIFAHDGNLCDITIFSGQISDCNPVIDKKYTDMVTQILSNRYFKLQEFPMFSNLDFADRFVFLKSGTSRNFADNWTIGYTDHYIIGVWVGNKDGSEMKGVSGASGAGDIFNKLVYLLEQGYNQTNPNNLQVQSQPYVSITSPLDKSLLKYDDSLPSQVQKIKLEFKTNIDYDQYIRTINDKKINNNFRSIQTGNYLIKVQLFDKGKEMGSDEAKVEVE